LLATAGELQDFIHPIHNGSSILQLSKTDLDETGLIITEGCYLSTDKTEDI